MARRSPTVYIPCINDHIGANVVVDIIAEGGMAYVFKVKNEALEVIRVVKLMKYAEDIDHDRFVVEARISANLNHPNIVQCYYFGKYAKSSLPYIEMEYIEGTDLHKLICDSGPLPVPVAASIAYYICKALFVAHNCKYTLFNVERTGIVHRDVKPANILISKNGNVKLTDFGIAKPKELSTNTSDIEVVGSPFYLSPEQLDKHDLDFRTDIYSLGCVIYEMVAGKRAFGNTGIGGLVKAKYDPFYPLDYPRNIKHNMKDIIRNCMKPSKDKRYANIELVLMRIESVLNQYRITNPEQIIYDFIKNPTTYTFYKPEIIRSKKTVVNFIVSILLLAIISFSTVGIIHSYINGSKEDETDKTKKTLVTNKSAKIKKTKEINKTTETSGTRRKNKTKKITNKTPKKSGNKRNSRTKETKNTNTTLVTTITNDTIHRPIIKMDAISEFLKKNYNNCLNSLNDRNDLSGIEYLCKIGALIETNSNKPLSLLISKCPNKTDGYYSHILGRVEFNRKAYKKSVSLFLSSKTEISFFPRLCFYSDYYIAKAKYENGKNTPSNVMVLNIKRSLNNFLKNYRKYYYNSKEYRYIKNLNDKYTAIHPDKNNTN